MKEIEFKIVEHIGVINDSGKWKTELNLVSWNGQKPKYDIRSWNEDHTQMGKGVTLSEEELDVLKSLLRNRT